MEIKMNVRPVYLIALAAAVIAWMCGCAPRRHTVDCKALPAISKALHACIDAVGVEMNIERCQDIEYRYNALRQSCPVTP